MNFKVNFIILSFAVCVISLSSATNEKICGDISLINTYWEDHLSEVEKLKDCTIVDGSIKFNVIKSRDSLTQISNISFPNLREIRGSLLISKVDKLNSLKYLFPKLMVIRGQFGLQIVYNKDLLEIGLTNLKYIGGAIINKNPKLCYVNTINWIEISNVFPTMKSNNDNCPKCSHSRFCWNEEDSQLICDHSCISGICERDGTCCSSECLGCSTDPNDCIICRNLSYNGTCVQECPENTFLFKGRSCVTSEECKAKNSMLKENETRMQIFNEECTNECSSGFTMIKFSESNFTCVEFRKNVCNGDIVINDTSIFSNLVDGYCEIITGSVEINLSIDVCEDKNLLRNLKMTSGAEEIYKYLKITGTTNMRNLGFLSRLKRIRGIELVSDKYSLILENNENLRNLWLPGQNVTLDRGETKLEGNPKLCLAEECENIPIELEIKVTTYAAEIKWNSTKSLPNNLKYAIWKRDEYYEIARSFCLTKAKSIEEDTPGVHKIYALKANEYYVYQMFDGNSLDRIGTPKRFRTLNTNVGMRDISVTSSSMTFHWNNLWFAPSSTDRIFRQQLKIFRIQPNYEFYKDRNYCTSPNNNATEDQILERNQESRSLNIAVIDRMKSDIKKLFKQELLNEETSKVSLGREYIYKDLEGTAMNCTFDNVEHFSEYFVSIRACYKIQELDCSKVEIFSIQTSADDKADQIDNLTGIVVNSNAIELKWKSPSRPNGLVLTFSVYFGIVGSNQMKTLCINYKQFEEEGNKKLIENLLPGNYSLTVVVRSLAGYGIPSDQVFIEIKSSYLSYWIISSLALILLVFAILLVIQIERFRSPKRKMENSVSKPDAGFELSYSRNQSLPSSSSIQQIDDPLKSQLKFSLGFELERDDIEILNKIGSGQFGSVYKGILRNHEEKELDVAIKTVNKETSLEDSMNFLKEAAIMKNFKTFHVIKLLGIVSKSKPYFVVMELMTNGDLKTLLRRNRPHSTRSDNYSQPPLRSTVPPVSQMAIQIADGMAYLAEKKFVHRDLASRNCMVSDDLTVKIGDFGMTRDIYEADYYRKRTSGLMPVRWMAPESLKDGIFSSESDVFSYGIVLWEIATYAEQPYKGKSNPEALNFIINGGTESRPVENCSDRIYEIMTKCWRFLPEDRISFNEIIEELLSDAPANFTEKSFYCLKD